MATFNVGDRVVARANKHVGEHFQGKPGVVALVNEHDRIYVDFDHTGGPGPQSNGGTWSDDSLIAEADADQAAIWGELADQEILAATRVLERLQERLGAEGLVVRDLGDLLGQLVGFDVQVEQREPVYYYAQDDDRIGITVGRVEGDDATDHVNDDDIIHLATTFRDVIYFEA